MSRHLVTALMALALSLAPACKKEAPAPPVEPKAEAPKVEPKKVEPPKAEAKAPAGSFQQPLLAALTKAGCKVGPFEQTAARPYQAKACVQGDVDGLDVLLCTFDGDQAARAAESTLLQFVGGSTTGAVRARGPVSLAVADRKKVDLKGKQINKVLQTFAAGSI
jgi:hypothetical protein